MGGGGDANGAIPLGAVAEAASDSLTDQRSSTPEMPDLQWDANARLSRAVKARRRRLRELGDHDKPSAKRRWTRHDVN